MRDKTLKHIPWSEPDYLNIDWEPSMGRCGSCLAHFPVSNAPSPKCPECNRYYLVNGRCVERCGYVDEALVKTCPECGGTDIYKTTQVLPVPHREITRDEFDVLFHGRNEGLLGINYDQLHIAKEATISCVNYYFFHWYALAVAEWSAGPDGKYLEEGDMGTIVQCEGHWASRLRYFSIGCQHPNRASKWVAMHDKTVVCPDCGQTAMYDTSG